MKLGILKIIKPDTLYFREELEAYTKRIDFELAYLSERGEITKHYQGIYSKTGSLIRDEDIINKIMSRDRHSDHLIISPSFINNSTKEYIILNYKRSDFIETPKFNLRFQITTHGFPKKLTEDFLLIHRMNTSQGTFEIDGYIEDLNYEKRKELLRTAKLYGNKKTFKLITDKLEKTKSLEEISIDLSTIGAPLILKRRPEKIKIISHPEKTIAEALKIAIDEPRIHNIIPFTILKNSGRIDFDKLQSFAKENGTYRYAGFILDLLRHAGFDKIPEFKAPRYSSKPKILFESKLTKRGLKRLQESHLNFALNKWGILTDTHIESELEKIRKWS